MLEKEQTTTLEHPSADILQPSSKSHIGMNNTFSTIHKKPQDLSQTLQSIAASSTNNHKKILADLHDRFEGKKDSLNALEEKARKRKEQ